MYSTVRPTGVLLACGVATLLTLTSSCSSPTLNEAPTASPRVSSSVPNPLAPSADSPIALITEEQGREIFGTSDRNGTHSLDAATLVREDGGSCRPVP